MIDLIAKKGTAEWNDYRWQLKHSITQLWDLEGYLDLSDDEKEGIRQAGQSKLSVQITPHFLSLIDRNNRECPLRRQVVPRVQESAVSPEEMDDPCGEDAAMVVPGLVHRYPDRVLLLVTDRCASYCRYCTRSRLVSSASAQHQDFDFEKAFAYLREHTEVRDVLLSGGDPLLLSDHKLGFILTELRKIPHIEFLRIGTRTPIFLPQRITPELCTLLRKHAPLFLSVHVNHANELSEESRAALIRLADHGIPLGSQTVLLKGVNDHVEVQKKLYHQLLRCSVRPYYLYQCDIIKGSQHFRTSIETGLDIIRNLQGFTTGYAIPQYVIDAPGGGGKVPINPDYVVSWDDEQLTLRNFAGEMYQYPLT